GISISQRSLQLYNAILQILCRNARLQLFRAPWTGGETFKSGARRARREWEARRKLLAHGNARLETAELRGVGLLEILNLLFVLLDQFFVLVLCLDEALFELLELELKVVDSGRRHALFCFAARNGI